MRTWIKEKWAWLKAKVITICRKIKLWLYALMIALGVFVAVPGEAEIKTFNWVNPTEYVDGAPLDSADIQEIRIYCDNDSVPFIVSLGDATTADSNFIVGIHTCFATAVVNDIESAPSNVLSFEISPVASEPVTDFSVN